MNAYVRWAALVASMISAPNDLRTLALWARHVGASVSTIRARCLAADVAVLASRDLARLLRVVARTKSDGLAWDPAAHLEACDPRTLRRLLLRSGLADWSVGTAPPSVERFLDRQRFVPERAVAGLRTAIPVTGHQVPMHNSPDAG